MPSSDLAASYDRLLLALLARDEHWTDEDELLAVARWLIRELGSADAAFAWLDEGSAPCPRRIRRGTPRRATTCNAP
jgi:hypothetical protein